MAVAVAIRSEDISLAQPGMVVPEGFNAVPLVLKSARDEGLGVRISADGEFALDILLPRLAEADKVPQAGAQALGLVRAEHVHLFQIEG
jgi:hypothetical protein